MTPTPDLCDQFGDRVAVAEPLFRDFGGRPAFAGEIETVRVFEDNALVRRVLEEEGRGRVLVVDGGGSRRCALVGGRLAALAADQRMERARSERVRARRRRDRCRRRWG